MAATLRQLGKAAKRTSAKPSSRGGASLVRRLYGTTDPAQIHAAIESERVTGSMLTSIRESLGLDKERFAPLLAIGERTLARREESRRPLPRAEADRLYRVARIADLAVEMFGDSAKAHAWLRKKIPALGFAVPLDLLRTEVGTRHVEQVLYTVGYGGVT